MKADTGCTLADLKGKYGEEAIVVGIGGLLIGSTITHSEIISTISTMVMRTFEMMIGTFQNNLVDSGTGKLIIASTSPGTILIYQKNKESAGMRKERSRWEIIEDMLKVLIEEKKMKKTRIMQRACLNWRDLQKYFDFLLEEGFIAECTNPGKGNYEITEKGRELLKRLKNVEEILR